MIYRYLEQKLKCRRNKEYCYFQLFIFSMLFFTASILTGVILYKVISNTALKLLLPSLQGVDILTRLLGGSTAASAMAMFLKNMVAVVATAFLARRTRGISILLLLGLNGLIIGSVLSLLAANGHPIAWLVIGVMPHGLFEFTGVFLGSAFGLKLLLLQEKQFAEQKQKIYHLFFKTLIPIFLTAAFIEAFITPIFLVKFGA